MNVELTYLENFPFETAKYLELLSKNNNREWFHSHKKEYEEMFLKPAQAFVQIMGLKLKELSENFVAIPKVDKSIFRIYKDARFSKGEPPYKTHLGIIIWEGTRTKKECSGFYFQVEPKEYLIGAGVYRFGKEQLKLFRNRVCDERSGSDLQNAIDSLNRKGYEVDEKIFKQTPRGFGEECFSKDLLLFGGLYSGRSGKIEELKGKDIFEFSFEIFKDVLPLHEWMVQNLG